MPPLYTRNHSSRRLFIILTCLASAPWLLSPLLSCGVAAPNGNPSPGFLQSYAYGLFRARQRWCIRRDMDIIHERKPQPSTRNTIYVLQASSSPRSTLQIYKAMIADLGADNVFLLFDDTHEAWTIKHKRFSSTRLFNVSVGNLSHQIFLLNASDSSPDLEGFDPTNEYWQTPTILKFFKTVIEPQHKFAKASYFWFFEEDVRCNGHYLDCLAPSLSSFADLLCFDLQIWSWSNKNWAHWGEIGGWLAWSVPRRRRASCFMPFRRLSRTALRQMAVDSQASGGYLEVYYPTLFTQKGLECASMPDAMVGTNIWQGPRAAELSEPVEDVVQKKACFDAKFYHPIKTPYIDRKSVV